MQLTKSIKKKLRNSSVLAIQGSNHLLCTKIKLKLWSAFLAPAVRSALHEVAGDVLPVCLHHDALPRLGRVRVLCLVRMTILKVVVAAGLLYYQTKYFRLTEGGYFYFYPFLPFLLLLFYF